MIEAIGVGVIFSGEGRAPVAALRGVTLGAARGEITGLLGPNGAGKSTFFRTAAGLLPCAEGRLRVAGHDVARDPQRVRASLGLLTEEPGLPRRSHPLWHLVLHGALRGMTASRARERALRLLAEFGLMLEAERPCGELSRGSRLRVALARALMHDPPVLLLDEPTATLDMAAAAALRRRLAGLARDGRTVLLATHNPHEAEALCSLVHLMREGRILASGSPGELRRRTGASTLEQACLALLETA
jgi:ABC-type multidrug transport system ATPase subunit